MKLDYNFLKGYSNQMLTDRLNAICEMKKTMFNNKHVFNYYSQDSEKYHEPIMKQIEIEILELHKELNKRTK